MTVQGAIDEINKAEELQKELDQAISNKYAEGCEDLHQFQVQIGAESADDLIMMLSNYKELVGNMDVAFYKE